MTRASRVCTRMTSGQAPGSRQRLRHVREPARGRGGDRYDRHQGRRGLHRRLQPSDRVRLGEATRAPCDSTGTRASRQDALRFGECSELERESAGGTVSASASTKNVSIGLGDPPPRLVPTPFWLPDAEKHETGCGSGVSRLGRPVGLGLSAWHDHDGDGHVSQNF